MTQDTIDFSEVNVFHFEEGSVNFNDVARQNGFTYWFARDYMQMLGYESYSSFKKAINRAMTACMTLDIVCTNEFEQVQRDINGKLVDDFKLSRFACYLVAMNADVKKQEVAQAQAFFAASAEAIRRYVDDPNSLERVLIRDEISQHEKTLSAAAHQAGVDGRDFALFQNAGYRGLYNKNINELKNHKGMGGSNRSLLDFMGRDELAANLFRITQTEAKLRKDNVQHKHAANQTAFAVGRKVRDTMIEISGQKPEDLELEEDIKKVKTSLKQTHKGLKKIDS